MWDFRYVLGATRAATSVERSLMSYYTDLEKRLHGRATAAELRLWESHALLEDLAVALKTAEAHNQCVRDLMAYTHRIETLIGEQRRDQEMERAKA